MTPRSIPARRTAFRAAPVAAPPPLSPPAWWISRLARTPAVRCGFPPATAACSVSARPLVRSAWPGHVRWHPASIPAAGSPAVPLYWPASAKYCCPADDRRWKARCCALRRPGSTHSRRSPRHCGRRWRKWSNCEAGRSASASPPKGSTVSSTISARCRRKRPGRLSASGWSRYGHVSAQASASASSRPRRPTRPSRRLVGRFAAWCKPASARCWPVAGC